MSKQIYILAHQVARQRAIEAVRTAPEGYRVIVSEPPRSLDQNAAMWPILTCFARQRQWPINGDMTWLTEEEWKDILTAAFEQDMTVRVAPGIKGGMVMLGRRTSKYGKRRFSEFLDWLNATAVEMGIDTREAA